MGALAATEWIIDVDSHVAEAPDLWTSRAPSKWRDVVPQLRTSDTGVEEWWAGTRKLHGAGMMAMAGWPEFYPSFPPTYKDMDPGAYDPAERVKRLDEFGIYAQVLFPNILGFATHAFLALAKRDIDAANFCTVAYNDYLIDFAAEDPNRLVPLMCLPFWDIDASVKELERARERGHRGIVFAPDFERVGLPPLHDEYWSPILTRAQDSGLSVNFHTGFSAMTETTIDELTASESYDIASYAKTTALFHVGNINAIASVIMDGTARKFPDVAFVSIESGYGYIPHLLEELDWQWLNNGAPRDYPGEPLPSEVFHRQIYGAFWHEHASTALLEQIADNIMFETDYPHPTGLNPGPASTAKPAREHVTETLKDVSDEVVHKVLWANAARLYNVAEPAVAAR
jgi:predicted TIM-barrel fold metal-dependent hydrolase